MVQPAWPQKGTSEQQGRDGVAALGAGHSWPLRGALRQPQSSHSSATKTANILHWHRGRPGDTDPAQGVTISSQS